MSPASPASWTEANQQYLAAMLGRVRRLLETRLEASGGSPDAVPVEDAPLPEGLQPPPALEILVRLFQLSDFERDLLLLCAGVELDTHFGPLLASLHGDPGRTSPTFSLALAALPEAHWTALAPSAPLRHWRLVELGAGGVVTQCPLRIDERILHFLTGITHLDERLTGYVAALPGQASELVPSQAAVAGQVVTAWGRNAWGAQPPVVELVGSDSAAHRAIAATVSARLNLNLYIMQAAAVPANVVEMESLRRLWEREALLSGNALLLDCEQVESGEQSLAPAVRRWIEGQSTPLILSGRERLAARRPVVTFEVSKPSMSEQRGLWQAALGAESAAGLNGRLEGIVAHFNLDAATISLVTAEALQQAPDSPQALADALWKGCTDHSRPAMSELAQYIRPLATWDDLVLPEAQLQTLHEIGMHVRQRMKVYETWGFAARSTRGLGISALFSGVSGTGKTMAAEVLANELRLELYRIDLSQVVSKYIGETEKNLRRVFDAAEEGGTILLFDEADALFGKRSEVKDSHDRYANVEVSYLLQRMEAYRGLAILTTNLKESIDQAFMRRIRFVVHFPFPDAGQRAEIWRRVFPAQTPTAGLDMGKLARLNIPGGNIRNIALYAAFLAADSGGPVRMSHLQRAARVEFAKLERPLNEAELGGWS
jgi:hypothetical protein